MTNVEKLFLPFKSEIFELVYCKDILEHLEYINLIKEIHRVLIKGGQLIIEVPHFTSRNAYTDPTHKKYFSIETFNFFVKNHIRNYYFDFAFSKINELKITFEPKPFTFINKILETIINQSFENQIFYELTFLSRIFPAKHILVTLVK
ncbi:MAG TPA: methyltransferase domain-containing protein [bacterium]|nr:methyltransferase domain-containing protein [bacterium]